MAGNVKQIRELMENYVTKPAAAAAPAAGVATGAADGIAVGILGDMAIRQAMQSMAGGGQ